MGKSQTYTKIVEHLNKGGEVIVSTYGRHTRYTAKHAEMFKLGKSGSLYVRRGKTYDCLDFTQITLQ